MHGDLLDGLPRDLDLIVANLPYLAPGTPGYDDEPPAAVFSTGDGLDHYRRLLAGAADHLVAGGGVLIQYEGEVLEAERSELPWLRTPARVTRRGGGLAARSERLAARASSVPIASRSSASTPSRSRNAAPKLLHAVSSVDVARAAARPPCRPLEPRGSHLRQRHPDGERATSPRRRTAYRSSKATDRRR